MILTIQTIKPFFSSSSASDTVAQRMDDQQRNFGLP
jgi:hypothetical protein